MKEKLIAGRYRVTGHLGQGGVGQVLKCLDEVLSNQVAVKILHTGAGESELVRFQKEAQTMAHLEHPNIVKVLDFGLSEGLPFLVMELCEADSLASWLETGELFDFESSYQIIHQIASALAYAHQQGVLHRDIKPSNVLLTYDSRGNLRTRICDFGLAKLKQDQQAQALTSDGAVIGSPAYISPEAVSGGTVDARSDIYSFGCLMFEMLTGRLPFSEESIIATMMVRLDHKSPTLEEVSGIAFAPEVEEVVSNCLKKDPADRFQNVAELESALDEAYELCCRPEGELAEGESDKASDLSAPDSNLAKQPDPAICSKPGDWLRMGLLAGLVAVCVSTLLISGVVSLRDTSELISVGGTSQTPVGDEATILDDSISIGSELEDGIVWTRLHGPCVSRDVSRVLGVKNLQYLRMTHDDLSDNGFEILVERRVLLRGLKLDCCILGEATLRAIGRIRTLEFLELNECKGLSGGGLSYVQSCRRLKDLELADTDSGDNCVADIARLTNLQTVNLSLCKRFHGRNIDGLRVLGRLETLRLSKSGFQPDQIGKLVSLEHLKKLELARLSLDDDDIKKISGTSVRKIDLSNNRLTDRALWSLDGMSSLEDLNIEGNPGITETGARRFLKRHPHCKMHFHRETYRQLPNFAKT